MLWHLPLVSFRTVHQYTHKTGPDQHAATWPNSSITQYINWCQYCNLSEAQTASSLMMVQSKPKRIEATVIYCNVNFNLVTEIYCALVGVIKSEWAKMHGITVGGKHKDMFNDTTMHMPGPQQHSEPWHCRLSQQSGLVGRVGVSMGERYLTVQRLLLPLSSGQAAQDTSMFLCNAGNLSPNDAASYPRRPEASTFWTVCPRSIKLKPTTLELGKCVVLTNKQN